MTRVLTQRMTLPTDPDRAAALTDRWEGNPDIGRELIKAAQHAKRLYDTYYKRPASEVHRAVGEIAASNSDPIASPHDGTVISAWERLPSAIGLADEICAAVMVAYGPHDPKAMEILWHAEHLYYSLANAEALLQRLQG